jgi:hypothetical protein
MTALLLILLSAPPCLYWPQGLDSRAALEGAAIKRICVPPDQVEAWVAAGFAATPMTAAEFAAREVLPVPGVTARAGVASPTRAPWLVASGWRMMRNPAAKYAYTLPAGKAALAVAEAFAYGTDAVVKIDPADLPGVGAMLAFLDGLPPSELPPVADFGMVDDESAVTGEVMNLLARRNLLFEIVKAPAPRFRLNVTIGSAEYPREAAADPSAFAQTVRARLTDDQRSLRIYGSEVVIGRLTAAGGRARLHLLNYGGREIEGLRIRVRGSYQSGEAFVAGAGRVALEDHAVSGGATELTLPRIVSYAVIDLK